MATVIPCGNALSIGYEIAVLSTGRPAAAVRPPEHRAQGLAHVEHGIRMPEPTRNPTPQDEAIDTLSVAWLSNVKGRRIQARLTPAATGHPRSGPAAGCRGDAEPSDKTGGPGIFPIPVSVAKPHTVRANPRGTEESRRETSPRPLRGPGRPGAARAPRTMLSRLTRHEREQRS